MLAPLRMNFYRKISQNTMYKFFSNAQHEILSSENESGNKGLNIIRLDFKNTVLSDAVLKVKSKKMRSKFDFILVEGLRLLKDMMLTGHQPTMVFFSRLRDIQNINFNQDTKLYKTPYKDLQLWSNLTTSSGILAICKTPKPLPVNEYSLPVTLICDQIREPGNLGAIVRNAAGAGVKKIILMKGCVDMWDPKVLRSGCGAHFRIPIYDNVEWEDIYQHFDQSPIFLLATNEPSHNFDAKSVNVPIQHYSLLDYKQFSNIAIVAGGETGGLSLQAYETSKNYNGMRITIPLENQVESLNAASAISVILFEVKKQLCNSFK